MEGEDIGKLTYELSKSELEKLKPVGLKSISPETWQKHYHGTLSLEDLKKYLLDIFSGKEYVLSEEDIRQRDNSNATLPSKEGSA